MVGSPKKPVKDNLGVNLCIVRTFCVLFVIKLKILMKWHMILLLSSLYVVEFLLFSTAPSARLFVQDGQDPKQGKRGIHHSHVKYIHINYRTMVAQKINYQITVQFLDKPKIRMQDYLLIAILNYFLIPRAEKCQQFPPEALWQSALSEIKEEL